MNQAVQSYLTELLTKHPPYEFSPEDKKLLDKDPLSFITSKLFRKKFRRRQLPDATREAITEKVRISLTENRPLHFTIPFGGYKHFWNPSHPEPDWAELFNFKYLTEYVSPILAVHKPGVLIEYVSEDMILPMMNNYPPEALDRYGKVYTGLIEWYNKYVPENLEFKFFRIGDRYDKEKMFELVRQQLPARREAFMKLSQEEKDQELHRSNRSILWNGKEDLTNLSEEDKQKRIIDSRITELAYYEVEAMPEFLGNYYGEDNHICICFSWGTSHDNDAFEDLTLGSTYGSIVDHWIGRGILEHRGERFIPDIISRNQYAEMKDKLTIVELDPIVPFQNFKQIEVLAEPEYTT